MGGIRRKLKTPKLFGLSNWFFLRLLTFMVFVWSIYIVGMVLLVLVWLFPTELVVLLNRFGVGSIVAGWGWESGLIPIRSGVDIMTLMPMKPIKVWTLQEKIDIIDQLMREYNLQYWADDERGYNRWKTKLLANFDTPETVRAQIEVISEQLFKYFEADVDEIYTRTGWRPRPTLEQKRLWFKNYEGMEKFLDFLTKEERKRGNKRRSWGGWK